MQPKSEAERKDETFLSIKEVLVGIIELSWVDPSHMLSSCVCKGTVVNRDIKAYSEY